VERIQRGDVDDVDLRVLDQLRVAPVPPRDTVGLAEHKLITHRFPLSDLDKAFTQFLSGESGKVVVTQTEYRARLSEPNP